ncbi:MAG: FtsX-like permease family protein [Candidatus Eisenbacteria bacterium]|nr:FtsX-like permease family protein [Candidatus Eisenbacteria bacterium]
MSAAPSPPPRRASLLVLLLLSPIWMPPFLLLQAVRLCADGLIQLYEERTGRVASAALSWRLLLGVPALVLFPLLVGLRALLAVILGLGSSAVRLLRPGWLWGLGGLLVGGLLWGAGQRGWISWPDWIPVSAALLCMLSSLLARLGRGGGWALAPRFLLGLIGMATLLVWLPVAIAVWIVRWVIWRLLVPEFARGTGLRPGPSDERLVTFVGLRYLFSRRESALHSATNYYAAGGIALGVCALIVVLAVMSGFDREIRERIVGTNAHVILLRYGSEGLAAPDSLAEAVAGHAEVTAVSPFVFGKAMLSAGTSAEGAMIKGIDWERSRATTAVAQYVQGMTDPSELERSAERPPGIVVGAHIAANLGLYTGDEVVLISPAETRRTPLGFVPRMRRFRLAGLFESGMYDFDANMAYVALDEAQSFFGLADRVTGLEVRLRDMNRAPQVARALVDSLGGFPYRANNWIDLNANLFAWMRTEKRAMFVILTMIILVAGFNIASSLVMLVTEKRREIGILKSMGTSAMGILRIFVLEGWVIALAGTALGSLVGLGLCGILERYRIIRLPEDIYFIDTLPVRVEAGDVWLIVVSVLGIAALATLYPAWRAARLDPVDAIRSE